MPACNIAEGAIEFISVASVLAKVFKASLFIPTNIPGLVQNCPIPKVIEPA